jgi:hypothetical protein
MFNTITVDAFARYICILRAYKIMNEQYTSWWMLLPTHLVSSCAAFFFLRSITTADISGHLVNCPKSFGSSRVM